MIKKLQLKIADNVIEEVKYIKTLIAFFVFILLFTSCQKEITADLDVPNTTPPVQTNNIFKAKTYTEDVSYANGPTYKQTFNLSYDNNDRLISFISATSPGDKFTYTYNPNNTYTMDLYQNNKVVLHERFFLNNLPFVDITIQYETGSRDTTTEKYIYNSSKQLAVLKEYSYTKATGSVLRNTTTYTYDSKGNLVKETEASSTTNYDYYPDLVNNLSVGLIHFYQNKNLVKTTTQSSSNSPTVSNHTYTFDNNRITSEKEVSSSGVVVKTYTY